MDMNYRKLLLSELHMAVFKPGKAENLNDASLTEAITVNENLRSYGFTLKPKDIIALAASDDLAGFYEDFIALVPEVKADPMYPDFPSQVMEMSEAQFRLHQAIHYFSTYGIELLTGTSVEKGWLPKMKKTEKTEKDITLLEAKVLDLVAEEEAYITALQRILGKRERPSLPERELILEAVKHVSPEQLKTVSIPFKENLLFVFSLLMDHSERDVCIQTLSVLCKHTGDVLKCVHVYLKDAKYHLRTSQKKTIVRLLECFPEKDFRENLMRSDQEREKNLVILRHLDFNQYCSKAGHREAVRALRNGELLSWEGQVEAYLREKDPCALSFIGKRPGMLLRKLNRLVEMGYSEEELTDAICVHARKLSPHTLVQTIKAFSQDELEIERKYNRALQELNNKLNQERRDAVWECRQRYRIEKNRYSINQVKKERNSDLCNCYRRYSDKRKKFSKAEIEEWKQSAILTERKNLGIPEVEEQIKEINQKISGCRDYLAYLESLRNMKNLHVCNVGNDDVWNQVKAWFVAADSVLFKTEQYRIYAQVAKFEAEQTNLKEKIDLLFMKLKERKLEIKTDFLKKISDAEKEIERLLAEEEAEIARINVEYDRRLSALSEGEEEIERLNAEETAEIVRINAEYEQKKNSDTFRAEIAGIEQEHDRALKRLMNSDVIKRILSKAMSVHFSIAETPFKGKKVFLDLKEFDLEHSELELQEKTAEGGYIRSGIAYKIPDAANYVRFFTYWNDRQRVDIDLHASGYTMDGQSLHVGWNGDFKDSGVVFSGDITHSNAAEYIDIDLSAPIRVIYANINLFCGKPGFNWIKECFTGLMAVNSAKEDVKHYDPANCFFTHTIHQHTRTLYYGYIDVQNRYVRFVGQKGGANNYICGPDINPQCQFSLEEYLRALLEAQQSELVTEREEAEVILTMGKSKDSRAVSLADNNFFLEY